MSLIAQTPAQGLFLAVTALNSKVRDVMVRAFLMGCSDADAAEWRKLVEADKKRRQRANVPLAASGSSGQCPADAEGASGTMSRSNANGQRDSTPQVPPTPPSSPASSPAYVRPAVEQVLAVMNGNTACRIPNEDRAKVAQAYLDARNRTDPPWTLPADHERPPRIIGADWQADCRIFCRNWQDVLARSRARESARIGSYGGLNSARARAEPDTTPLTVDPARWTAFLNHPDYSHFHRLKTEPPPKTETDIPRGAVEDFKNFKRRNLTPR